MKQIFSMLLIPILCAGCLGQSTSSTDKATTPPRVGIRVESGKTAFKSHEDVTMKVYIKNLTSNKFDAPTTCWSAHIMLDGKEYRRLPEYTGNWKGSDIIDPAGELNISIKLSEYGIQKESFKPGKHAIAVKIVDVVSNTLNITIGEQPVRDV